MTYYIALIHKDRDSCYGVTFPDAPGVTTAGDTIDDAMKNAEDVLEFASEDWTQNDGTPGLKAPRTIDQLRTDPEFLEDSRDALIALVPCRAGVMAAA